MHICALCNIRLYIPIYTLTYTPTHLHLSHTNTHIYSLIPIPIHLYIYRRGPNPSLGDRAPQLRHAAGGTQVLQVHTWLRCATTRRGVYD